MKYVKQLVIVSVLISAITTFAMQQPAQADQINALFTSIRSNNAAQVATLLQQSSNPKALADSHDDAGIAALREAATGGNIDIVKSLIRAGADANPSDSYDLSPLMLAALQGHTDVVRMLITLGANVNARDKSGQSVLQWVQFGGATNPAQKQEITDILTAAGAR